MSPPAFAGVAGTVYRFDPLRDPRWLELTERHPDASVFHTPGWMEALRRTYGYEPFGLTVSPPDEDIENGIVLCEVRSWLTGRRLVSLPFSDHCQPLADGGSQLDAIVSALKREVAGHGWQYVELRPLTQSAPLALDTADSFCYHQLDLRPSVDELFQGLHKSCVQRKIARAEREKLHCSEGRSKTMLAQFYDLLVRTRRRHHRPPPPIAWFRSLVECFGDRLTIRVAERNGRPIASILTLRHRDAVMYKYGSSDSEWHYTSAMHALLWSAIQAARAQGAVRFDMGRSDLENTGLIDFKSRWGARPSEVTYLRHSVASRSRKSDLTQRIAGRIVALAPDLCLAATGRILYRHFG